MINVHTDRSDGGLVLGNKVLVAQVFAKNGFLVFSSVTGEAQAAEAKADQIKQGKAGEDSHMIHKTFMETERGPIARVTFSLPKGTWADTIYLIGDFNDWNPSSHPFQHDSEEGWTLTVDLEVSRCYQFRYRRDGEWINDGQADGYVHNRHGSDNFLVVTDSEFEHYSDDK